MSTLQKILSITLFTLLLTANQDILEDLNTTVEDTNITQSEDVNLSNLTEDELFAELMKSEKELETEKVKTEAIIKLGKTVDKLSEHLNIQN